jgi:hypothetical protein
MIETTTATNRSRTRRLGPYFFLRSRPFREARIRGYIVEQHRLGRPLAEIVRDPYVSRFGSRLALEVLCQAETIAALEEDVLTELERLRRSISPQTNFG